MQCVGVEGSERRRGEDRKRVGVQGSERREALMTVKRRQWVSMRVSKEVLEK